MPPTPPNSGQRKQRGRAVPPAEPVPVVIGPIPDASPAYRAAVAADSRRFLADPNLVEFERDMLPGEAPAALPPGTRVRVTRLGRLIARSFITPSVEGN